MPTRPVLSLSSPLDANRDFAGVLELYSSEPVILPLAACCASGYCAPVPVHRKRRLRRRDIRRTSVGWHRCSEARHARRADRRYTGKQSGPRFKSKVRIEVPLGNLAKHGAFARAGARKERRSCPLPLDCVEQAVEVVDIGRVAAPVISAIQYTPAQHFTLVDWTAR